jgi:hypothetical protein
VPPIKPDGFWRSFFSGLFGFLRSITVGVFKDPKLSAGRRANILLDVVAVIPCVLVFAKCNEYLAFTGFVIYLLFSAWCLLKVR